MNKLSRVLPFALTPTFAACLVLGTATLSQAQNFMFTSSFTPNVFTSNTSSTGASIITVANGSSIVPNGTPTNITLGSIGQATTPGGGPNTFDISNGSYSAVFALTDVGLNQTDTATIRGYFGGMADGGVGGNAPSALITNTFTSPSSFDLAFRTGTYTVSNLTYLAPGAQNATPGSFGALVTYTPALVTPAAVPEPGSIALLIGIGVTGAGFLSRRRRQQAHNAA